MDVDEILALDDTVSTLIEVDVAAFIKREFDLHDVEVNAYGILLAKTGRCWIQLKRQITNWEVMEVIPDPTLAPDHPLYPAAGYPRAWSYNRMAEALHAALKWDGAADTEPSGWVRAIEIYCPARYHGQTKPGVRQM